MVANTSGCCMGTMTPSGSQGESWICSRIWTQTCLMSSQACPSKRCAVLCCVCCAELDCAVTYCTMRSCIVCAVLCSVRLWHLLPAMLCCAELHRLNHMPTTAVSTCVCWGDAPAKLYLVLLCKKCNSVIYPVWLLYSCFYCIAVHHKVLYGMYIASFTAVCGLSVASAMQEFNCTAPHTV